MQPLELKPKGSKTSQRHTKLLPQLHHINLEMKKKFEKELSTASLGHISPTFGALTSLKLLKICLKQDKEYSK
uniref:Uncharacterized protein n=1 Tax=Acanthochromis polyacanthus TaxID=80966 RepID=A0A3Q1FVN8_9TELE